MKKIIAIVTLLFAMQLQHQAMANGFLDDAELKARIGYSIGGTAPIGLPATIRKIDSYTLTPSIMFGADIMKRFQSNWGLMVGLRFENKGMDAGAVTKNYHMEVTKGGSKMDGVYTGHIEQKVQEWMFTLPIFATYRLGKKTTLKAGPYFSLLVSKDFSGYVYDGYLRQGDPTGPKVTMGTAENERATYDFSDDMRNFQVGVAVGADWQIYKQFGISADLNWGLNGIFKKDFKTVEQTLYPIYGTIGLFYKLK